MRIDNAPNPAITLAKQFISGDTTDALLILSGPSGVGKSRLCARLAADARASGLVTAGLIAPAVFSYGQKVAIELVDQISGERRRVAGRRAAGDAGLITEQWTFDTAVLAWGDQRLRELPPADLVFIDELGPLELRRGQGLLAGLALIERRGARIIVVIRPALLAEARARWPWGAVLELSAKGCDDD